MSARPPSPNYANEEKTMVYAAAVIEAGADRPLLQGPGAWGDTAPALVFGAMGFLVAARMRAGG